MAEKTLVWAFIPYIIEECRLNGYTYDTAAAKAEYARAFHELDIPWIWQPIVAGSLDDVVAQVASYREKHPAVVFNFCDGNDQSLGPGVSVVRALEAAGVPFTGADSAFFQLSTEKIPMKQRFQAAGVATAAFAVPPQTGPVKGICAQVPPPLFVKPSISAGSYGIGLRSVAHTDEQVEARRDELRQGEFATYFAHDIIFAESFIQGPEFTVFVGGYWDQPDELWHLPPAWRAFDESIPLKERFLSYDRYWAIYKEEAPPAEGRAFYTYQPAPAHLKDTLIELAKKAFIAVGGTGYARVDFRQNAATGELLALEVNANCGLSGDDESSCGSILQMAGLSISWLFKTILDGAMRRA